MLLGKLIPDDPQILWVLVDNDGEVGFLYLGNIRHPEFSEVL